MNGKRSGQGIMIYKVGIHYDGKWQDDQMNGQGQLLFSTTESVYYGEFKNGMKHGKGK